MKRLFAAQSRDSEHSERRNPVRHTLNTLIKQDSNGRDSEHIEIAKVY